MAFADPQSVTIGSAISLPRTSSSANAGQFTAADGNTLLAISHQYPGSRIRRSARLNFQKTAANPLNPSINSLFRMSCFLVVDLPLLGFTVTEQKQVVDGLTGWLTASSGAKETQLLGGEN